MNALNRRNVVHPNDMGKSTLTMKSSYAGSRLSVKSSDAALFTTSGKRKQMAKILLATTIPIIVLFIQTTISLNTVAQSQYTQHDHYKEQENNNKIAAVIHQLQDERLETVNFLSSTAKFNSTWSDRFAQAFNNTNQAIGEVSWDHVVKHCKDSRVFCQSKSVFLSVLEYHRRRVKAGQNTTYDEDISFYSDIIQELMVWILEEQKSYHGSDWHELVAFHTILVSEEQVDIERDLGLAFFDKGGLSMEELSVFSQKSGESDGTIKRAVESSTIVRIALETSFYNTSLDKAVNEVKQYILLNVTSEATGRNRERWIANHTEYQVILERIQKALASEIMKYVDTALSNGTRDLITGIAIVCLVAFLSPVIILFVYNMTHDLQVFAWCLKEKAEVIKKEKRRTEYILHQVLPVSVAEKLKNREPVVPEFYDSVTVFFSDIVGFTRICSESTPLQVVGMLNSLYQALDSRIEVYEVYKVETIGDAYMVASGVPLKTSSHCSEIATMALDLLSSIRNLSIPHRPNEILQLRTGIHTGPCVAGVVGFKMPRYCLFGDTINTASRMESTGEALKIHISQETYNTLSYHTEFEMSSRGETDIKGKGKLITYWLQGKRGFHGTKVKQTTFANQWTAELLSTE